MRNSTNEGALTRLRHERKLVVSNADAAGIEAHLRQRLEVSLRDETSIVSVYFDFRDLRLARAALSEPGRSLKVRTKEYSPDLGAPDAPRCVVEIKRHVGPITRKRRVWVARSSLPAVFSRYALVSPGSVEEQARTVLGRVGRVDELRPLVAVTYRRRVYQISARMRVTVDRELAFYRIHEDLAFAPRALDPSKLGAPLASDHRAVVEIKHLGSQLPAWAAVLGGTRPQGFSKFGTALAHLGPVQEGAVRVFGAR